MKHPISRYAVIILSCFLFVGSIAQAGPHHPKHKLEMMDKKLALTDAQEKAVGAILEANQPIINQTKQDLKGYKKRIGFEHIMRVSYYSAPLYAYHLMDAATATFIDGTIAWRPVRG